MTVTDSRRLTLFDQARSTMGEEAASTLMDLLPADTDELTTKSDLRVLSSDLRSEMAEMRADLRTEMAELRAELHQALAEQTRTLVLTSTGITLIGVSLAFAAAHFV